MTREEAIVLLNQYNLYSPTKQIEEAIDIAIEALSADAVSLTGTMKYLTKPHNYCEVVRCKDCRNRFYDKYNDCYMCDKHEYGESFEDNDFCSWGERREP